MTSAVEMTAEKEKLLVKQCSYFQKEKKKILGDGQDLNFLVPEQND